MRFDWTKFMDRNNKIAVHCKTEEEANDFCKKMYEHGLCWSSYDSYLENSKWYNYKANTYYTNEGTFGTEFSINKAEGYTILEWRDYMEKPFTKADLDVGDIVKTRKGNYLVILPNENSNDGLGTFSKITLGCDKYLQVYDEDLTYKHKEGTISEYDIVAVLRTSQAGNSKNNTYRLLGAVLTCGDKEMVEDQFKYVKWDWERKEEPPTKELTMEELEKHFGCKVKIVAED